MKIVRKIGWFLTIVSVSLFAQQPPRHPILLKSAAGTVKFEHTSHLKVAARCVVCHHPSKPLKPLKSAQQACTDCHTKPPTPPVTTGLPGAFHNSAATAGLCIDCHKQQNAGGKAAPVKCVDCHQKAG